MAELGRPPAIDEIVLAKLEEGFVRGLSDREACLYAGIHPATLYRFCEDHPDFRDRKELLKDRPKVLAKLNIYDALKDKDKDTSRWYAERRIKDEFSTRSELTAKDGEALIPERKQEIEEAINQVL
jgi:hypothetical protein